MLGFFFGVLSSLASFAFPVIASYKALQQDDITLLRPWLMYWVVLALFLTAEAYAGFVLRAVPLYDLWRLGALLWLVLPQFQGASRVYLEHVSPFLNRHESQLDELVAQGYKGACALGTEYLNRAVAILKQAISTLLFGPSKADPSNTEASAASESSSTTSAASTTNPTDAPPATSPSSYADVLFAKFRIPDSAYALSNRVPQVPSLAAVLSAVTSASSSPLRRWLTVPDSLATKSDRLDYVDTQRNQLVELLKSLDEQRSEIEAELDKGPEKPSVDDQDDFDVVARDEASETAPPPAKGWFW